MRHLALWLVTLYQRYLSPYKGFCCAYRVHTGRPSCSTLGYRAIRRYGTLAGLTVLRRRTARCGVAHRRHAPQARLARSGERGDCDLGCIPDCELPSSSGVGRCCNAAEFCDACSCDWPGGKKDDRLRKKRDDSRVHMPPRRSQSPDKGNATRPPA